MQVKWKAQTKVTDEDPGLKHSKTPESQKPQEEVHDDDLCPICHLLLYKPVTTRCNHTMCEFCLNMWADVSVTTQMTAVGLDDDTPEILLPNEIESSCPMCRTSSTARPNKDRERELKHRYPNTYSGRQAEAQNDDAEGDRESVETMTLYIGNTHRMIRVETDDEEAHNRHEWKFFVRPSRTDLIEEVQVFLHPTFRNPRLLLQYPPYEVRRLGWGYFTIDANVVLKAGYHWLSSDAEDSPDGAENGSLPFEWLLDFDGGGSQKRCRLKVRREKEGQDEENEAQREEVRRLWMQQRQTDPDYVEEDVDA
jgi:hypothetical protein